MFLLLKTKLTTNRPSKESVTKYFLVKICCEKSLLADTFSGRILIDGVDIAQLGLGTLRSKLTIIPQVATIHNVVFAQEDPDKRVLKDL